MVALKNRKKIMVTVGLDRKMYVISRAHFKSNGYGRSISVEKPMYVFNNRQSAMTALRTLRKDDKTKRYEWYIYTVEQMHSIFHTVGNGEQFGPV